LLVVVVVVGFCTAAVLLVLLPEAVAAFDMIS
jgi:hypothetical protein